jgi:hypothetical protein
LRDSFISRCVFLFSLCLLRVAPAETSQTQMLVTPTPLQNATPTGLLSSPRASSTFTLSPTPYLPAPTLPALRNVTPNRTLTAQPLPTATRLPTETPLPTVPAAPRSGLWAENLIFGEPQPVDEWRVDGGMAWSPDGKQLAFVVATDYIALGSFEFGPSIDRCPRHRHTIRHYLVRGSNPQHLLTGRTLYQD